MYFYRCSIALIQKNGCIPHNSCHSLNFLCGLWLLCAQILCMWDLILCSSSTHTWLSLHYSSTLSSSIPANKQRKEKAINNNNFISQVRCSWQTKTSTPRCLFACHTNGCTCSADLVPSLLIEFCFWVLWISHFVTEI